MSNQFINQNLITIIPGSITIQNFIPGKLFKESIVIYNTSNVPITLNLNSNDKSKLTLSDNYVKLGVNQAKKISLNIQDKNKYNNTNLPTKNLLSIHLSSDLIDENFEINLIYYRKKENENSYSNLNTVSYEEEYLKYGSFQNKIKENEKEVNAPKQIISNLNNIQTESNGYLDLNNFNLQIEKNENFKLLGYNNNNSNKTINELNGIIQNLLSKISEMKQIIDSYIPKKNYINDLNIIQESISLFFISDQTLLNDSLGKKKIELENKEREQEMINLQNNNNLLLLENQTLTERIKILEGKLQNQIYNMNNFMETNENNNEILLSLPNNVNSNKDENLFQKGNLDSFIPSQYYSKDASQKQSFSYEGEINFKSNDNNNNPIS